MKGKKSRVVDRIIVDRIIEQIERNNILPWQSQLASDGRLPYNYASGYTYQGRNLLLLMAAGYTHSGFLTYKQAHDRGYNVRHGESGWPIIYAANPGFVDIEIEDAVGRIHKIHKYRNGGGRLYYVFNVSQIDGIPDLPSQVSGSNKNVENFLQNLPVKWMHGKCPVYTPRTDVVGVPLVDAYESEDRYYSDLFHELIHWTGREGRLNRGTPTDRETREYMYEELVAEIGSAYLRGRFGIQSPELDDSNAAYVKSWLDYFHEDKNIILSASIAAQKAVTYLVDLSDPGKTSSGASVRYNVEDYSSNTM